jgi:pimeloyl-ACP methyl ester carboxylesterase
VSESRVTAGNLMKLAPVKSVLLIVACLGMAGVVGCRGREIPRERYLDVDAGGHRLHMLVVGASGPVVVLESGWPGCGLGWERVRGPVGRFARVVTYDRAGTGKSEPGPLPRHAEQIAGELHTALRNAGLAPPYILVGQSWGGPCIRVFARMYHEEVSGMVLVDPTQPDACEPAEEVKRWMASHCPDQLERIEATLPAKVPPGFEILLLSKIKRLEQGLSGLPEPKRSRLRREWWGEIDGMPAVRTTMRSISPGARDEMRAAADTFRQAVAARPLPKVPIILLAAGRPDMDVSQAMSPGFRELTEDNRLGSTSIESHARWVEATPGARLIIARDSGHNIQTEQPHYVIDAIREVVEGRSPSDRPSDALTVHLRRHGP